VRRLRTRAKTPFSLGVSQISPELSLRRPATSSSFLAGTRTQLVFDDLRSYLLKLPLEVFDLIPQLRRVLELELLGGGKHLGLEIGDEVL
jgi:hypothetical protein